MTFELDPAALDLARFIRPGDTVAVAQGAAEPLTLTEALVAQSAQLGAIKVFLGAMYSDTFAPEAAPGFRYASYGALASNPRLARAGRLEVVPCHYSQLPWLLASGPVKADVVMLALSPAVDGVATLGAAHGYALAATTRARVVLAEVNERMPWVHGGELPADFRVDAVVRTSRPLPRYPVSRVGQVEREVAANVAGLIPDGATLQFGIGTIADAVLGALAGHRDLGLHTGMLSESVLPLLECGVVTNRLKAIDTGVTVNGIFIGDESAVPAHRPQPGGAARRAGVHARDRDARAHPRFRQRQLGGRGRPRRQRQRRGRGRRVRRRLRRAARFRPRRGGGARRARDHRAAVGVARRQDEPDRRAVRGGHDTSRGRGHDRHRVGRRRAARRLVRGAREADRGNRASGVPRCARLRGTVVAAALFGYKGRPAGG